MKAFDSLTYRGQLQRLRQLAQTALANYAVPAPHLIPLSHIENTTFRVVAADQQHYVLRIHRPDGLPPSAIGSEMEWLKALRQETDLMVPEPVVTLDGSLLTIAETAGIPEPRTCVLFRWMDGRFFDKTLSPQQLEQVGIFTAQLHEHSAQWPLPADFVRGRVDAITEAARRTVWKPTPGVSSPQPSDEDGTRTIQLVQDLFSNEDAKLVARVLEHIRTVFDELGEDKEVFGLIHADLHQENYLFQQGRPCAIDFDDCGWGHFLFDLNVTLREISHLPHYLSLRAAFLAGYRSMRPLSVQHEAYLDTFFALRRIQLLIWVIESRDHPAFRDGWQSWARNDLQELEKFLTDL